MYQGLLNFRPSAVEVRRWYRFTDPYDFVPSRNGIMLEWATRVVSCNISNSGSLEDVSWIFVNGAEQRIFIRIIIIIIILLLLLLLLLPLLFNSYYSYY